MPKLTEKLRTRVRYFAMHPESAAVWCIAIGAIVCNAVALRRNYDYWSRMYEYALSACVWGLMGWITYSLFTELRKAPLRESEEYFSGPLLAMSCIFTPAGVLGYLYFFYFQIVFRKCDKAVRLYAVEQTVIDYIYECTMMVFFPLLLAFVIQRARVHLIPDFHNRLQRHMIMATILLLFVKTAVEEAYHTFEVICHERHEFEKFCPTEHHYHCNETLDLSQPQQNWLEMHEQVLAAAIFLIIAELLPLLFAFFWEISAELEEHLLHVPNRASVGSNQASKRPGQSQTHTENSIHSEVVIEHRVSSVKEMDAEAEEEFNNHLRLCVFLGILLVFVMLVHLGIHLNWIGQYPGDLSAKIDTVGTMACFFILFLLLLAIYFRICPEMKPYVDHKRVHHAYLDVRLLIIACVLTTVLCAEKVIIYHKYHAWTNTLIAVTETLGSIFVACSSWGQYIILQQFLAYGNRGLLRRLRTSGLVLASCSCVFNLLAWLGVFVDRRFSTYILQQADTKYGAVVAAAAEEPFYPAMSFFYFHCTMCWSLIILRYIRFGVFKDRESGEVHRF